MLVKQHWVKLAARNLSEVLQKMDITTQQEQEYEGAMAGDVLLRTEWDRVGMGNG